MQIKNLSGYVKNTVVSIIHITQIAPLVVTNSEDKTRHEKVLLLVLLTLLYVLLNLLRQQTLNLAPLVYYCQSHVVYP